GRSLWRSFLLPRRTLPVSQASPYIPPQRRRCDPRPVPRGSASAVPAGYILSGSYRSCFSVSAAGHGPLQGFPVHSEEPLPEFRTVPPELPPPEVSGGSGRKGEGSRISAR